MPFVHLLDAVTPARTGSRDIHANVDILIVDPSDAQAEMTLLGVRKAAATATTVRLKGGDEALQFIFCAGAFRDRPAAMPRLILLELEIPVMNGLHMLDRLRREPTAKRVPVVLLTSSLNPFLIESSYALGASRYVVKPAQLDRYIAKVAEIVEWWLPSVAHSREPERTA